MPPRESPEVVAFRIEVNEARTQTSSLLFLDPPDHTPYAVSHQAFTPRRIEDMRMSIRDLTEECLDELAEENGGTQWKF